MYGHMDLPVDSICLPWNFHSVGLLIAEWPRSTHNDGHNYKPNQPHNVLQKLNSLTPDQIDIFFRQNIQMVYENICTVIWSTFTVDYF